MINEMKKVSIVCLSGDEDKLLKDLMWIRGVEISKPNIDHDDVISVYDCSNEIAKVEDSIQALEKAIKILSPKRKDFKKLLSPLKEVNKSVIEKPGKDITDAIAKAYRAIFLLKEMDENKLSLQELDLYKKQVQMYIDYPYPLSYTGTQYAICQIGTFPLSLNKEDLIEKANEITQGAFYLREISRKDLVYVSAVYHKKYSKEINELFNNYGYIPGNFPVRAGKASQELELTIKKMEIVYDRQKQIENELKSMSGYCPTMELAIDVQRTRKELLENKEHLICTGYTTIITGWISKEKSPRLQKKLEKYKCYCELSDPEEGDDVPIELKNNFIGSPYEKIVEMYSNPKYGSYDPSFWTGIFFSIMIGIIFADAGYGILFTLLATLYLLRVKPKGEKKKLPLIVLYCGICCTIAGVLFGGYFGDLPAQIAQNFYGSHALDDLSIVCSPTNDPMTFIIISIAIGVVHLCTGIIIRMKMDFDRKDWKSAIFDNGSYLIIFAGIGVALINTTAGLITAGVGCLMILLFKGRDKKNIVSRIISGLGGLYGLINYASDLLSYSRLFALALSGAVIAQVVNTLATMNGFGPMFIIVIPIGHLLNIALSAIGAFVHTLRLQFLEFYGKFFEEGGRKLKPISPQLKYVSVLETDE